MRFTCLKNVLSESISVVTKAVAPKSNLQFLEGLYIYADNNNVRLIGNDLEIAIEANIPATVSKNGGVVLNAKMFFDIVRKMPEGMIDVETDSSYKTTIICENVKYEIMGLNHEEYPVIEMSEYDFSVKIPQNKLKNIIRQTAFSIGTNDNKPTFTGALLEIDNDMLKIIALDGYRMAYRMEKINSTDANTSYIIPGKTLNELSKIFTDEDKVAELCFTDKKVTVKIDNYIIYSRLIEGEFFNYEQIIPKVADLKVVVSTKEITESIERTALVITMDNKSPIKMVVSDGFINMSSISRLGKAEDKICAVTEGNDIEIGFNHKYILDALRAAERDKVSIEFTNNLSPCVIKPVDSNDFIYLILPVRLKTNE